MVNTSSALESRGRGFKFRSRQFLEFHLCSFIYIYIYCMHKFCFDQQHKFCGLSLMMNTHSLHILMSIKL